MKTMPSNPKKNNYSPWPCPLLKIGDKVRLNDEGIATLGGFIQNRSDMQRALGDLTVENVEPLPVQDDQRRWIKNFASITIAEFPEYSFDSMHFTKVNP